MKTTSSVLETTTALIKDDTNSKPVVYQVYRKRWLILLIYFFFVVVTAMQWIQYSVITNVVAKYYNVSNEAVDWSSMIYLVLYIPFSFPGNYILDKLGLRKSVLIGIIGSCVGTWVKVASVAPDRYWVVMAGQSIISVFQVLVLPVPTKLAAVWFGEKQVNLACSISIISLQIGIAVGFIIPPLFISEESNASIEQGLHIVSVMYAIVISLMIPVVFFFFDDEPPTPPSRAQHQIKLNEKPVFEYKKALIKLFTNRSFMALVIIFGVNVGVIIAVTILLNQIVLIHYPYALKDIGVLGLLMMVAGVAGSYLNGYLLDRTGKFTPITIVTVILTLLCLALFFLLVSHGLTFVYVFGIGLSFLSNSMYSISYQLGIELTYPEPEGSCTGLLALSSQFFGVVMTYTVSYLLNNVGESTAYWYCTLVVFISDCSLLLIRFDLKRQAVSASNNDFSLTP